MLSIDNKDSVFCKKKTGQKAIARQHTEPRAVARQRASGKLQERSVKECPVCQRVVQSSTGLAAHLRKVHQHYKPPKEHTGETL